MEGKVRVRRKRISDFKWSVCHTVTVALFSPMTEFPIKPQGLDLIGAKKPLGLHPSKLAKGKRNCKTQSRVSPDNSSMRMPRIGGRPKHGLVHRRLPSSLSARCAASYESLAPCKLKSTSLLGSWRVTHKVSSTHPLEVSVSTTYGMRPKRHIPQTVANERRYRYTE